MPREKEFSRNMPAKPFVGAPLMNRNTINGSGIYQDISECLRRVSFVSKHVKLPFGTLTSHTRTPIQVPTTSLPIELLVKYPWKGSTTWAKCLSPSTHLGGTGGFPGFLLWSSPNLAVATTWEVN